MAEHWSDCSVHNEPMSPAGPCDCTPTRSLLLREAEIADLRVVLNVVRHCAEEHKSPTAQDVDDEVARLARALSDTEVKCESCEKPLPPGTRARQDRETGVVICGECFEEVIAAQEASDDAT